SAVGAAVSASGGASGADADARDVYRTLGHMAGGHRPDHGSRSPAAPASRLLARSHHSSPGPRGEGAEGDAGIGVGASATDHCFDRVHPRKTDFLPPFRQTAVPGHTAAPDGAGL